MQLGHGLAGLRVGAALRHPGLAQLRQPLPRIVTLRAARVVQPHRRFAAAQRDLAHRHAQLDAAVRRVDECFVEHLG